MTDLDFDWNVVFSNLILLSIAYLLALPIGWERETRGRSAGLRTFPLVAIATCGYVLIGMAIFAVDAQARVVQGMITGMGFIGGGAILKGEASVHGIATAAALWSTGAIGLAVAYGRLEIAVSLALVTFVTLRFLVPIKAYIHKQKPSGR